MGQLARLQALVLSENQLENLPSTIIQLKKLRTLLQHKNQLTTLPPQIVALKELMEVGLIIAMWSFLLYIFCILLGPKLSLRDNPLVVRFVRDLTYNPPTLLELAGRVIKSNCVPYNTWEIPQHLAAYLASAHQCVNPKCQGTHNLLTFIQIKQFIIVISLGVYFDSRVEHVKFVDFCGKYRIPLLQYLCSPNCTKNPVSSCCPLDSDSDSGRLKKVLLG